MKVKIIDNVGMSWYFDSDKDLIVLDLEDYEKEHISNMVPEADKYCVYNSLKHTEEFVEEAMIKW